MFWKHVLLNAGKFVRFGLSFNETALSSLWLSVKDEYPMLSQTQLKFYFLLPLPTCARQHFRLLQI